MSDRETNKLIAPSGKEFVVKTYLTARERNELRSIFLQTFSVDTETGQSRVGDLSGDILERAEHTAIQIVVISYDGNAENVLERMLDASPDEYDFIVAEANKLVNFKKAK